METQLLDYSTRLKKAFDMVNHETLLFKLQKHDIQGNTFSFLESYVNQQKQYVLHNDALSKLQ